MTQCVNSSVAQEQASVNEHIVTIAAHQSGIFTTQTVDGRRYNRLQ